jgi:hypothetical protein
MNTIMKTWSRCRRLGVGGLGLIATLTAHGADAPVQGWIILAGSETGAREVIRAAPEYGINHLELSQEIIADLRELHDEKKRTLVKSLIDQAHQSGVTEVLVWDHPLYALDYYPSEFRRAPGGKIDLDNPAFWTWFKADYRALLDRIPQVNGVVVTFLGTAGHAEEQVSQTLTTRAQKFAAVINAVADVVIGERHLNLYVRIFPNDAPHDPRLTEPVALIARPEVRLMIKQSPLDYFLTAPSDSYIGSFARPTLVEFELTGEFSGEGAIANTWIEDILQRWRDLSARPHVIGYTIRTDRLGESRLVGKPGEMNLLALARGATDRQVTAEAVYDEFIARKYGKDAVPEVKAAFKTAFDVVTASLYTLGTPLTDHSKLDYDLFPSLYGHLVSGRWMDPPIARVRHGVNREFHLWRDVIDHLAPPFVKDPAFQFSDYTFTPQERAWLHPGEAMDEEYLRYIVVEKNYGVDLAAEAIQHIENVRNVLAPEKYEELHRYFERTWLTARLQRGASSAYFGFRVWCRGPGFQTGYVRETVQRGLDEIKEVAAQIRAYPIKPPTAQYLWAEDADRAERYFRLIVDEGWPAESSGIANPNAGMKFPYRAPK